MITLVSPEVICALAVANPVKQAMKRMIFFKIMDDLRYKYPTKLRVV